MSVNDSLKWERSFENCDSVSLSTVISFFVALLKLLVIMINNKKLFNGLCESVIFNRHKITETFLYDVTQVFR